MVHETGNSHGDTLPARKDMSRGIVTLAAIFVACMLVFCISIFLPDAVLAQVPYSLYDTVLNFVYPMSVLYTLLGFSGLALTILYRRHINGTSVAISALFVAVVFASVLAPNLLKGFYDLPFYLFVLFEGVAVFFIVLGSMGLLNAEKVLRFRIAAFEFPKAAISLVLGAVIGLAWGLANMLFLQLFLGSHPVTLEYLLYGSFYAGEMGALAVAGFDMLLLGLTLSLLKKSMPEKQATVSAILLTGLFSGAGMLLIAGFWTLPGTLVVPGLTLGIPAAYLAVKRDIESSIGYTWAFYTMFISLLLL